MNIGGNIRGRDALVDRYRLRSRGRIAKLIDMILVVYIFGALGETHAFQTRDASERR